MPAWLDQRARLTPDRLALITDGERLTWAELRDRAIGRAAALTDQGLKPGDRVALLADNGAAYVELIHALMRAEMVLVPLNTRQTASELAWQLADCGARLLIHDEAHQLAAGSLDGPRRVDETALRGAAAPLDGEQRVDLSWLHSIVYTSGTTGRPKGAMLTYGNHWWSALGSAINLGLHGDDRWLCPLPLFHLGGLSIVMRSVIYGIPAIVPGGFDEAAVNRAIDDDGVTIVSLVAAMLRRVLDQRGGRPFPPWLRCVLLGGGPAPRALLDECLAGGAPVVQTYGLTETASQAATLLPEDARRKPGSAGKPLFPTELRIDDVGQILVRGPTVSPGYWNEPRRDPDAWFPTGDVGRLDEDGYLYVVDRREDLIVSGGENVYPAEVEAALAAHPAVAQAAVVGRADERWGAVPIAHVVARSTVDAEALRAWCRERLAAYKVPAAICFRDELPRNAAGKVLRRELRS